MIKLNPGDTFEGGYYIGEEDNAYLVVAPSQMLIIANWQDAIKQAKQIDGGKWRLPTLEELQFICKHKDDLPLDLRDDVFLSKHYWTKTEYWYSSEDAWTCNLKTGVCSITKKLGLNYAILVKRVSEVDIRITFEEYQLKIQELTELNHKLEKRVELLEGKIKVHSLSKWEEADHPVDKLLWSVLDKKD